MTAFTSRHFEEASPVANRACDEWFPRNGHASRLIFLD
ncbi:hypothetical protein PATSB16_03030 [Pandoraea thiooxydans]|nr:hypothetical protein PATSB16_03030 [Pandoraea thiooxydans]